MFFYFGSRSNFNNVCYKIVTNLKRKYPYITRIYVRAEYPNIDDSYKSNLLKKYESTFFTPELDKAEKLSYVIRNQIMIKQK